MIVHGVSEKAEVAGRRIAMELDRQQYSRAPDLLEHAIYDMTAKPEAISSMSLAEIGVGAKLCNALESSMGVTDVVDLQHIRTAEILRVSGLGPKAVDELWQCVLTAILKGCERGEE